MNILKDYILSLKDNNKINNIKEILKNRKCKNVLKYLMR